jgi:hypothetical protein
VTRASVIGLIVLIRDIALFVSLLPELLNLLAAQFDPKELFVVLHDLSVPTLVVHVKAVLAVLDQIRKLISRHLQKVLEGSVLSDFHHRQYWSNYKANAHYHND